MLRFHAQFLVVVSTSLAQFLDFGGLGRGGVPCGVEELLAGVGVKIPDSVHNPRIKVLEDAPGQVA